MKVTFIGAGPGDPKLITIKGKEAIESAGVVVYAGSLVNKKILQYATAPPEDIHDSAGMDLEDTEKVFRDAQERALNLARVHTGDPSIYGAINEQMAILDRLGIDYEVIPGVSSFQAAAATLCQELTLPELCQTITLTRAAGRTPVPPKEALAEIVKTTPTLILFLSVSMLGDITPTLKAEYGRDAPVAVVYRASWPDEKVVRGTLDDIAEKTKAAGITKTALIIVGKVLDKEAAKSLLYDRGFSHGFRKSR
ncbi:Cobalt-precorrin-4 C(11)-methyltransferase [hydrothermal vent metagenome]|uniref:Cobalt-precorrin-4 C(11)-methyltransferase n=1 Tax=hydrothermal vent metagenome TaxID=652676 RepID=A0A3B0QUG6_9ZZZZ